MSEHLMPTSRDRRPKGIPFHSPRQSVNRAEFPNLAALYEKYHSRGFDIFGVSYDANRKRWLECIETYGMRWTQIHQGFGLHPRQTQAWSDYTLGGIPSCFLIDCATEKIIAKQLRGEALAQKLSELLD